MKKKYLDGFEFFGAFERGAQFVFENKNHLNNINLFPVPDSDTGNNMSHTLYTTKIKVNPDRSIYNTIKAISNNTVESARGNSGLIMAHFFSGFYKKMKTADTLTTRDFARTVKNIIPYLYKSIDDPREGTMLTVIKDWGEHIHQLSQNTDDFITLFESSLGTARKSLKETKNKIDILKQNKTVDAGAQGFVYFLEGMLNYWHNSSSKLKMSESHSNNQELPLNLQKDFSGFSAEHLNHRYCTEILINSDISEERIRKLLKSKGDSLITVSSDKITRIHLHTNFPAEIVNILHKQGQIIEQKVDDMQLQQNIMNERKNKTALVTDSIADIPGNLLDKYQIHMIPINIIIDGVNYLDKVTITPDYLYQYIEDAENFPSSSQPGVKYVSKYLQDISEYYESILIISVSEALSGTGNVFKKAIKEVEKNKDINISYINSRLNSGAQGLLVLKAAEVIKQGRDLKEITSIIERYRKNSNIMVKLETLDYMIKGGRVSPMKGFLARLLNLKPVVSLNKNGEGIIMEKAMSGKSSMRKIKNRTAEINDEYEIEKYAIVHTRAPEAASDFADKIKGLLKFEAEYIEETSSVTALNSGRGAVALSFLAY